MHIRTSLGVLICCCAALAACTANAPKGPDATVTKPAVGRPPAPASEGAALASEAFTPFADLGAAANDGLAPGDTYANLHTACMEDAGYGQYAASTPFVTANQQALNAAVREFKANYAKELSRLPALLRTASATPNLPVPRPSHSAH